MLTKNAIGNLINRYRAVLGKCRLLNVFGSLAVAGLLVAGTPGGVIGAPLGGTTDASGWTALSGRTTVSTADTTVDKLLIDGTYTLTIDEITAAGTSGGYHLYVKDALKITDGEVNVGTSGGNVGGIYGFDASGETGDVYYPYYGALEMTGGTLTIGSAGTAYGAVEMVHAAISGGNVVIGGILHPSETTWRSGPMLGAPGDDGADPDPKADGAGIITISGGTQVTLGNYGQIYSSFTEDKTQGLTIEGSGAAGATKVTMGGDTGSGSVMRAHSSTFTLGEGAIIEVSASKEGVIAGSEAIDLAGDVDIKTGGHLVLTSVMGSDNSGGKAVDEARFLEYGATAVVEEHQITVGSDVTQTGNVTVAGTLELAKSIRHYTHESGDLDIDGGKHVMVDGQIYDLAGGNLKVISGGRFDGHMATDLSASWGESGAAINLTSGTVTVEDAGSHIWGKTVTIGTSGSSDNNALIIRVGDATNNVDVTGGDLVNIAGFGGLIIHSGTINLNRSSELIGGGDTGLQIYGGNIVLNGDSGATNDHMSGSATIRFGSETADGNKIAGGVISVAQDKKGFIVTGKKVDMTAGNISVASGGTLVLQSSSTNSDTETKESGSFNLKGGMIALNGGTLELAQSNSSKNITLTLDSGSGTTGRIQNDGGTITVNDAQTLEVKAGQVVNTASGALDIEGGASGGGKVVVYTSGAGINNDAGKITVKGGDSGGQLIFTSANGALNATLGGEIDITSGSSGGKLSVSGSSSANSVNLTLNETADVDNKGDIEILGANDSLTVQGKVVNDGTYGKISGSRLNVAENGQLFAGALEVDDALTSGAGKTTVKILEAKKLTITGADAEATAEIKGVVTSSATFAGGKAVIDAVELTSDAADNKLTVDNLFVQGTPPADLSAASGGLYAKNVTIDKATNGIDNITVDANGVLKVNANLSDVENVTIKGGAATIKGTSATPTTLALSGSSDKVEVKGGALTLINSQITTGKVDVTAGALYIGGTGDGEGNTASTIADLTVNGSGAGVNLNSGKLTTKLTLGAATGTSKGGTVEVKSGNELALSGESNIYENGTLAVNGGKVTLNNPATLTANKGTLTVNDGTITADATNAGNKVVIKGGSTSSFTNAKIGTTGTGAVSLTTEVSDATLNVVAAAAESGGAVAAQSSTLNGDLSLAGANGDETQVNVKSGTLDVKGKLTLGDGLRINTLTVDRGATLNLAGADTGNVIEDKSVLDNSGTLNLAGMTAVNTGGTLKNKGILNIAGGSATVDGTLDNTPGTVVTIGKTAIADAGSLTLNSDHTNKATYQINAYSSLVIGNGSTFTNAASSTNASGATTPAGVVNVAKDGTLGISGAGTEFVNEGSLANAGAIVVFGNGTFKSAVNYDQNGGDFKVGMEAVGLAPASAGTLEITGGTFTNTSGLDLAPLGILNVSGGTFLNNDATFANAGTINVTAGEFKSPVALTNNNALNVNGPSAVATLGTFTNEAATSSVGVSAGVLNLNGTVINKGTFSASGTGKVNVISAFNNESGGRVNLYGADTFNLANGATLTNKAGGQVAVNGGSQDLAGSLVNDGDVTVNGNLTVASLTNNAKKGASDTNGVNVGVADGSASGALIVKGGSNAGTLTVNNGKVDVAGAVANSGTIDVKDAGALNVLAGGTLTLSGADAELKSGKPGNGSNVGINVFKGGVLKGSKEHFAADATKALTADNFKGGFGLLDVDGELFVDATVSIDAVQTLKGKFLGGGSTGSIVYSNVDKGDLDLTNPDNLGKLEGSGTIVQGVTAGTKESSTPTADDKYSSFTTKGGFGADALVAKNATDDATVKVEGSVTLLGDKDGNLITASGSGSIGTVDVAAGQALNLGSMSAPSRDASLDSTVKLGAGSSLNASTKSYTVAEVTGTGDLTATNKGTLTIQSDLGNSVDKPSKVEAGSGATLQTADGKNLAATMVNLSNGGTVKSGGTLDTTSINASGSSSSVVAANGIAVTGNIIFTPDANNPDAGLNLTTNTGNLSAKHIDAGAGTLAAPAGDVVATSGEVKAGTVQSAGKVEATGGITARDSISAGASVVTTGGAISVAKELTAGGNVSAGTAIQAGSVQATAGKVEARGGSITTTDGGISAATGIAATGGAIVAQKTENGVTTLADVTTASGDVKATGVVSGFGTPAYIQANNVTAQDGSISAAGTILATGEVKATAAAEGTAANVTAPVILAASVAADGNITAVGGTGNGIDTATLNDKAGHVTAGGDINAAGGAINAVKMVDGKAVSKGDVVAGARAETGDIKANTIKAGSVVAEKGAITVTGAGTTAAPDLKADNVKAQVLKADAAKVHVGESTNAARGSLTLSEDSTAGTLTLEKADANVGKLTVNGDVKVKSGSVMNATTLELAATTDGSSQVIVGDTEDSEGGTLTASSLQLNGNMLLVDPAFSTTKPHNSSRVAVADMGDSTAVDGAVLVDGAVGVGRNAQVTIGTQSTAWLDTQVRLATGGAGLTQRGITAAFGLTKPAVLGEGRSIVVDGLRVNTPPSGGAARISMPAAFQGAANTVTFAPNSLFVVDAAAAAGAKVALNAQNAGGKVNLYNDAKLRLVDAKIGQTYTILGENLTVNYAKSLDSTAGTPVDLKPGETTNAWRGDNLTTNSRLVGLEWAPVYDEFGNLQYDANNNVVRSEKQLATHLVDARTVLPGLDPSLAGLVNSMALSGLTGYETTGAGGVMFLNRVLSTTGFMKDATPAERTITVQSVATAAVNAAPAAALSASNAAASVVGERTSIANPAGSAMQVMTADGSILTGAAAGESRQGVGLWVMPMYQHNEIDGGSATGGSSDFSSDLGGVVLGADYTFANNLRAGVSFNVGSGSGDADGDFIGTNTDFDFWGVGLYAGWSRNNFGLTTDLSYSRTSSDLDQSLPFALQMGDLSGDVDAWAVSLGIRGEYKINAGGVDIVPHAGIRYTHMKTDSYSLRAGSIDVVNGDSISQDVWTLPIGVMVSKDIALGNGEWWLRPSLDLAIIPAFGDKDAEGSVSFTGVAQAADVSSEVVDDFTGMAQIGVDLGNDNLSFGLKYNFQAGDKTTQHSVFGTLRYQF